MQTAESPFRIEGSAKQEILTTTELNQIKKRSSIQNSFDEMKGSLFKAVQKLEFDSQNNEKIYEGLQPNLQMIDTMFSKIGKKKDTSFTGIQINELEEEEDIKNQNMSESDDQSFFNGRDDVVLNSNPGSPDINRIQHMSRVTASINNPSNYESHINEVNRREEDNDEIESENISKKINPKFRESYGFRIQNAYDIEEEKITEQSEPGVSEELRTDSFRGSQSHNEIDTLEESSKPTLFNQNDYLDENSLIYSTDQNSIDTLQINDSKSNTRFVLTNQPNENFGLLMTFSRQQNLNPSLSPVRQPQSSLNEKALDFSKHKPDIKADPQISEILSPRLKTPSEFPKHRELRDKQVELKKLEEEETKLLKELKEIKEYQCKYNSKKQSHTNEKSLDNPSEKIKRFKQLINKSELETKRDRRNKVKLNNTFTVDIADLSTEFLRSLISLNQEKISTSREDLGLLEHLLAKNLITNDFTNLLDKVQLKLTRCEYSKTEYSENIMYYHKNLTFAKELYRLTNQNSHLKKLHAEIAKVIDSNANSNPQ